MKPARAARRPNARTGLAVPLRKSRPRPAVAVSAVVDPSGLLKPLYGHPGAKAPPAVVVCPAGTDNGRGGIVSARRVRRGVPVCNLPVSLAALDAAPAPDRAADMDDEGLRRLGAEIIAAAVDILRRPRPHGPVTVKRQEARRRELAARSAEAEFIRGAALDRCVRVFGVRVDPDAVRQSLRLS